MSLPLQGLKVLDLSRLLPGPYATLVLADLGATVDKVEEPEVGDYTRNMPPMKGDTSALFLALNRNKRSLALDLKTPGGVAALKRLARQYDVLVESFRPGVMDKLGVGYEVLAKENPRLVYCAISGYGATGPDRLRAGHDLNYIARAGALAYGGQRGGAPAMPGVQMADIGGGSLFALVGLLAALHERERTGRGRFVDVSMTDGAVAFLHMHLGARLMMGAEGGPLERGAEALNGGYPCYGLYQTQDGRWLAVGSLEPKFFGGLCALLGRPELMPGGYDLGEEGRKTRRELEAIFASKPLSHWVALLKQHDLCVEPVNEGDEVLADPQLVARGLFVKGEEGVHLKTPLDFGPISTRAPPALGADSEAVLAEAGFSAEERQALAKRR
ncbi:MAG: CoA transferase [Myxococcaceae bacterium]|nr:CoA transferase [Myxococcaceae bacterium]